MALGYVQFLKKRSDARDILDLCGMFFYLSVPFVRSFDIVGYWYALLLGVHGVLLLCMGVSTRIKRYSYCGIAVIVIALLSQTYVYVFSLPRWLITAAGGIAFLVSALFLLITRKDEGLKK